MLCARVSGRQTWSWPSISLIRSDYQIVGWQFGIPVVMRYQTGNPHGHCKFALLLVLHSSHLFLVQPLCLLKGVLVLAVVSSVLACVLQNLISSRALSAAPCLHVSLCHCSCSLCACAWAFWFYSCSPKGVWDRCCLFHTLHAHSSAASSATNKVTRLTCVMLPQW